MNFKTIIALFVITHCQYNALNTAINASYFGYQFSRLGDLLNSNLGTIPPLSVNSTGFLDKITLANSILTFMGNSVTVKKILGNIITLDVTFNTQVKSNSGIILTYLLVFSTSPSNLIIESSTSFLELTFDVKVTYYTNKFMLALNSNITYTYPSKTTMYSIVSTWPQVIKTYSKWITTPSVKVFNTVIQAYQANILFALTNTYPSKVFVNANKIFA